MDLRSKEMSNERTTVAAPLKYDAFWHLQAIGLLKPTTEPEPAAQERVPTTIWERLKDAPEALVALIDTGVSAHPYLTGRLVAPDEVAPGGAVAAGQGESAADLDLNFDLSAAPALPADPGTVTKYMETEYPDTWFQEWGLCPVNGSEDWQKNVKELVKNNINKLSFSSGAPVASNQKFSAHGTSCAGLVAASNENFKPSRSGPQQSAFVPPYYRGVDPRSKIISVTTSFAPRPDLLTLAFVLATRKGADVILFPRGLPREIGLADLLSNSATAATLNKEEKEAALPWHMLKETILAVSRRIPVVCAAGNESDGKPIAPACFAAEDNNGIISVAAMSYFGYRSSYSNFGKGITVAAPSDDAEILNRAQARLDRTDRFFSDHPYEYFVKKLVKAEIPFGEATIRSIDVPGAFGFSDTSSNVDAKLWTEPESFFTDFGGTSAAASIVAGVASLMQRAAKSKNGGKPVSGVEIRKLVAETARNENDNLLHLPERKLTLDRVDEEEEKDLAFPDSFGAGLIAADKAVEKILSPSWTPPPA
jgi:subtilisin family serine protease